MIALLPLRGWAGEVMATDMASMQAAHAQVPVKPHIKTAIESGAAHAHSYWSEATFEGKKASSKGQKALVLAADAQMGSQTSAMHDCEGHAKATKADAVATEDAACDSCTACQACHTLALSSEAITFGFTFPPATLARPAADQFASAAAALGQKPPIS